MEVAGQRRQSNRLVHDGFTYHLDSRYANKIRKRYLCSSRITLNHCHVKLWSDGNGRIEVDGNHNHRRSNIQEREPIIRELQNQALVNDILPNAIVNDVLKQ